MKKKIVSFSLSKETIEILKKIATQNGRSASNMIEYLVSNFNKK